MDNIILFADGARGIYIPQHFAEAIQREYVSGITDEDYAILESGHDNNLYWDTWDHVLNTAEITKDGKTYSLHQDGDLWIVAFDDLTVMEKRDFLGDDMEYDEQLDIISATWDDVKADTISHYGPDDEPAINEAFCDMVDYLQKDGMICESLADVITQDDL